MLEIDIVQCITMAHELSKIEILVDNFTDPRFYPPRDANEEEVARYFFFMVAIDHRTSMNNRRFEGIVNGEYYRGANLLYRLGALKFSNDPSFFSAERMARLTLKEAKDWLSVKKPKPMVIPGLKERVFLLRDAAIKLLNLYHGSVMELYESAQERLLGKEGLLDRLKFFIAYSDPVCKKPFLLVKFLLRRNIWHFRDTFLLGLPIDNHLTRIALRYGIVKIISKELKSKLRKRIPVSKEEDILIRSIISEAYKIVLKRGNLDPTIVDDILWNLGRSCCWNQRQRPACKTNFCNMPKCTLRSILLHNCKGNCPLSHGCIGSKNEKYTGLLEPNVKTWYY